MLVKEKTNLKALFEPETIAVIGSSRRKEAVGYAILHNLVSAGFKGKLYPINPNVDTLEDLKCYPSILEVPDQIDLAVIIVPSVRVPDTLRQCGQKGVQAVIVISAGFREIGGEGVRLEKEVSDISKQYHMPVLGPNCLGLINTNTKTSMNASFSRTMPKPGNIAFISQSGALCAAILDYAKGENIGFSKFISMGNKADLTELDMLRYLKDDPDTDVILMYVEDLVDGRAFIEVAREITGDMGKTKPIIAIKAGRTPQGAKAASSHTGSLMGTDEIYDAIFTQAGVIRAASVQELLDLATGFAYEPIPRSNRVVIVTNAGGPGIMATDACVKQGLEIAELQKSTREALAKVLPPTASLSNPVDVIGDAQHDRYEEALNIVAKDPNVDSVLVLLTPQAMTDVEETAKVVVDFDDRTALPVVSCFMGLVDVEPGVKLLDEHQVPNYQYPESAASALGAMCKYKKWLERPRTKVKEFSANRAAVEAILQETRKSGQKLVPVHQAMQIVKHYGFPVLAFDLAKDQKEAVAKAKAIGYPVVLKVISSEVVHKVDVGGVRLNLRSDDDVKKAYDAMLKDIAVANPSAKIDGVFIQAMAEKGREVILGMNRDARFGPVLMFGLGGIYVEALKDVTFRLAPIRERGARQMIQSIRSLTLLKGTRGEGPVDFDAITECLQRLSQLACENPQIKEVDINPLLVYPETKGACVIDARIIIE